MSVAQATTVRSRQIPNIIWRATANKSSISSWLLMENQRVPFICHNMKLQLAIAHQQHCLASPCFALFCHVLAPASAPAPTLAPTLAPALPLPSPCLALPCPALPCPCLARPTARSSVRPSVPPSDPPIRDSESWTKTKGTHVQDTQCH